MSMTLLIIFLILAFLGVPLSISLGLSAVATLWYFDMPLSMITQTMATSINSFLLIAVPLFVLAGQIMERGGLSERIFNAAEAMVGRLQGGLGHVNIVSSFIFGGISGSSVADIASLGPINIRAMTSRGFPKPYSAALTLITSTLATLVPPSILMIVAASASGQSVGRALAGGIGPGVLLGLAFCGYNFFISGKNGYGNQRQVSCRENLRALMISLPSIGAPIIILTGMFSGFVTPTEAAGLAVLYTAIIGFAVHRELSLKDMVNATISAGRIAGSVLLILMVANAATYIFTIDMLPNKAASALTSVSTNPLVVLLMMGVIFLFVGMLMDIVAAALMLIPVLLPTALAAGIAPLHFLVFMAASLAVGLATPPVGTCLFATAQVSGVKIEQLSIAAMPFYAINIFVLLLLAAFPQFILWPAELLN